MPNEVAVNLVLPHTKKKNEKYILFFCKRLSALFLKLLFNPMKKFVKSGSDQHLI